VSALIQKSFPYLILTELYLGRGFQLCVSENLMTEYYEVLCREKFSKFPDFKIKADAILLDIERYASFFHPKKKVRKIKDADDNMLLELALECKADFLVTGNTNDFTFSEYKKTKIVSPREY
jgi:uncharacterized protein